MYINELTSDLINNGRHGVNISAGLLELFILLLADDVILLSETVIGLQNQLNCLQRVAHSPHLKVNMSKSNIVVFRKGGYLGARERWTYNGVIMPVTNTYKYLGILISTRLTFVAACKDLASKGKKALMCILQQLSALNNNSFELFIKLFDAQVQPVVQYAAEIWGLDKAAIYCESAHVFALKKYLGVKEHLTTWCMGKLIDIHY